jgi:hypothetical protein
MTSSISGNQRGAEQGKFAMIVVREVSLSPRSQREVGQLNGDPNGENLTVKGKIEIRSLPAVCFRYQTVYGKETLRYARRSRDGVLRYAFSVHMISTL